MLLIAQFLPQVPDIDLDVIGVAEKVVTPHLVEDPLPGKHLVGMHHEQAEQIELSRGERNCPASAIDLPGCFIEADIADLEDRAGSLIAAAQHSANSRQQLAKVEWLDQVVVRSDFQPLDPILHVVFGGQDDHADVLIAPEGGSDRQAIELGHHDVYHDYVRFELAYQSQRRLSVASRLHLEALVLEAQADEIDDAPLVVDDQNALAADRDGFRGGFRHLSPI